MRAVLQQAGCQMALESEVPAVDRLLTEAFGRELGDESGCGEPDVSVVFDGRHAAFDTHAMAPLTRTSFHRDNLIVMVNAGGSGFDVRVRCDDRPDHARIRVEARYRPPWRERAAAVLLRSRFHLLVRQMLLQYPALWVAGTRGRQVLHAAAVDLGGAVALLAGPGGSGRSTLLLRALECGATACSDNLCVTDGRTVHGVVEPVRVAGGGGRRMSDGRGECDLPHRVDSLVPDRVIIARRQPGRRPSLRPIPSATAAHTIVAGTYMAGELRRYWAFAATLALGTGRGPAHPSVAGVADRMSGLPCFELTLGELPAPDLAALVEAVPAVHA